LILLVVLLLRQFLLALWVAGDWSSVTAARAGKQCNEAE
jgi:hypothetical protein